MKLSFAIVVFGLIACLTAQAGEQDQQLTGSDLTIQQAIAERSTPVPSKFASAAVMEALEPAKVMVGDMTNWATQKFKVVAALAGAAPEGEVLVTYRFIQSGRVEERAIKKGERVIWIYRKLQVDVEPSPAKALLDTDESRQAVLDALKKAGISVNPPATQPTKSPD